MSNFIDKIAVPDRVTREFVMSDGDTYIAQVYWIALLVTRASKCSDEVTNTKELLQISREAIALATEARFFDDNLVKGDEDPEFKRLFGKDYQGLGAAVSELERAITKLDERIGSIEIEQVYKKSEGSEETSEVGEDGGAGLDRGENPAPPTLRDLVSRLLPGLRGKQKPKGDDDEYAKQ